MAVQFDAAFEGLTSHLPFGWQRRLFARMVGGDLPAACDIPTGLGKTSVMAIWLAALALAEGEARKKIPRRLVYVVDRRAVVDQATTEAIKLRSGVNGLPAMKQRLGLEGRDLPISTLRGQYVDNRDWLVDPAVPAIVVGTVDMIGSRMLFSGYGVSPKMRPYQAGFLGADTLVVLDEAHLVPPFEQLLESIESGADTLGPRDPAGRQLVPPFRLLSLSATGRERSGEVFRLSGSDLADDTVRQRLEARKTVRLREAGEQKLESALAEEAWALSTNGTQACRIIIYCDSRETAERTKKAIETLAGREKKTGTVETELFVGARRVMEREAAWRDLDRLGFIAGSAAPDKPAFLVATSAGEVGVDLDADHMVCDLVPWERMVQRLGRVNRRGRGDARIVVVHEAEPKPKKAGEPTAQEARAILAYNSLKVFAELGADASPATLNDLRSRAAADPVLRDKINAATTPAPLRPALTRGVVEAWSMTALNEHPGRPRIQPWLRGWIDEDPQTAVVWREHLPVLVREDSAAADETPDKEQIATINAFFEAALPETSETLEGESWRIVDWLIARAVAVKKKAAKTEPAERSGIDIKAPAVLVLDSKAEFRAWWSVSALAALDSRENKRERDRLPELLSGAIVVVRSHLGGLGPDGLLNAEVEKAPLTMEAVDKWYPSPSFRVRETESPDPTRDDVWREAARFALETTADEESRWLVVDQSIGRAETEEGRAVSRNNQSLEEHQAWAEQEARRIATAVNLPPRYADMLALAARVHDEGKRARRWQKAFNAPCDGGPYAKTKGPINQRLLDGYRHEFGSLGAIEGNADVGRLPEDLKDLLLHLVAAHHGGGRPAVSAESCEDAPPSVLQDRARDVALRFARMQKRWGPWGLAWWESLLRAADQAASRVNDARRAAPSGNVQAQLSAGREIAR